MSILEKIHGHQDLILLDDEQRQILCKEIREFLVMHVAQTGGHLASNLGVVELSVALETVFDTEKDRLVFDVGHQSYIHKLLTGRQTGFDHLRQFGGMAGFPKPKESITDAFVAGHASSSVSIALGMARARTLSGQSYQIVTLLGDGAATGGMVYEGLNDAAVSGEPMVVILNDNAMSIDRNVGGIARHLSQLRTKEQYLGMKERYRAFMHRVPGGPTVYRATRAVKDWVKRALLPTTIFENMGFTYLGPVDGHDLPNMLALLRAARDMRRPVLIHVMTRKGQGYQPAEEHPSLFHGIGRFDPKTGQLLKQNGPTFSDAFGNAMLELAEEDQRVCAVTAAMPGGTGLVPFKHRFPKRLFDVGIAEEHAVSMAGGLAKQGMVPVVAIYSTFLQRSYDMIMQDVAMLKLHVVLAVDRAGLVGEDGETHHGTFDVGFLRQVPNMTILCPASGRELRDMIRWAVLGQDGPVAIRYPRGGDKSFTGSEWSDTGSILTEGAVARHAEGRDVTIITYGTLLENAMQAASELEKRGTRATVLRLLTVSPVPVEGILKNLSEHHRVFIMEETCNGSGIREALAWELQHRLPDCRIEGADLGRRFISHGDMDSLYRDCGLDGSSIAKMIWEMFDLED